MTRTDELRAGSALDGPTLDIAPPRADPWAAVTVPDRWREVARLARTVARDVDALADHIVGCIQRELDTYGTGAVPAEDIHASVARTAEMLLVGLAEHRRPTDAEVSIRRDLGVRRALQGIPVGAVIQAYQIGFREVWHALVRAVPPDDPLASAQLLEAATTVWSWMHDTTAAVERAYDRTARQLEAREVGARQRLVELLVGGDLVAPEASRLARSLGFDPGESFVVTVARGTTDDHDALELQHRLDETSGTHAVVARGPVTVIVTQAATVDVAAVVRTHLPDVTIGCGHERLGLTGARTSLVDAELTLEITPVGGTSRFEDTWLWATLSRAGDQLRSVLAAGVAVAGSHPHLAEAVRAFGEHGFSVTEAARQLAVHANTVGYRLDRWQELTGWDPRTFPGLVRSLAAIRTV